MTDIYLKFASEAEAMNALAFAVSDGRWIVGTHDWALDPVGTIVLEQPTYDADGNALTEAVFADGYHVNIRLLTPGSIPDLSVYEVHPSNPRRVWA